MSYISRPWRGSGPSRFFGLSRLSGSMNEKTTQIWGQVLQLSTVRGDGKAVLFEVS